MNRPYSFIVQSPRVEQLVTMAMTPNHPNQITLDHVEIREIAAARMEMMRLFMRLAIKLEAGVKPGAA